MSFSIRAVTACASGIALALAASACQQSAGNTAAAGPSASNGAQTAAPAPAAAAAAAPQPAAPPVTETGPVALAGDATLPAPCQAYVRRVQACLDHQHGDPTTDATAHFNNESLRTALRSSRGTWALAADDTYRARVCQADVDSFASHQRTMGIEC
jgi:hypothetical protein